MRLTPRLLCTASKIKKGSRPVDVGTDHAYLPIYLVENGICSRIIASDLRYGPLKKAQKNIELFNLKDKIDLRQGFGLSPIRAGEADCAVIAGMGGLLICKILSDGIDKADDMSYFVIQPMQEVPEVRKYFYSSGYTIYDEELVKERDKIYQVISAKQGLEIIDDKIYYEIGKKLIEKRDPLLNEFISGKIIKIEKIIKKIEKIKTLNVQDKIFYCRTKISRYEEVLRCL
ncbi:MAG: class I SAM-dependent methyltransferase [Clostridiales bacterium]|nr:class I SAM-dependent methyltransferase [Clostridiales bacterium]HBM81324.1 SAM-dependent methyltransferase [Clostridiaceae bacterium]